MTAISTLISAAFRENNLIAVGTSPTAAEQTEALDVVNRLVQQMMSLEKSANFLDYVADNTLSGTIQLYKHTRIVRNGANSVTLNFPNPVDDGARMQIIQGPTNTGVLTLAGNGYTIDGSATFATTNAVNVTPHIWFFRGDLGDWMTVAPQLVGDDFIFPPEFDDLFVTMISTRLAPRYNKAVTQQTMDVIQAGIDAFSARFFQGARLIVSRTNAKATTGAQ